MLSDAHGRSARYVEWLLRRNPLYLVSAALMAVGARLYLVGPSDAPGDIGLILTTLGAVQVYEWAVSGLLILLHRSARSPEDKPSLLLVGVLFWTGPMAATIEMTALHADLGIVLAAAVCLIALGELQLVQRALRIRITFASQLAACVCVVMLAVAPPFLRIPESGAGSNELVLYAAWWMLGGIALLGVGSLRWHGRPTDGPGSPGPATLSLESEVAFITLVIGATAAHLVGMNHAFFCHASLFYASPVIIAIAVVGVEYLVVTGRRYYPLLLAVSALPIIALILAARPFDANVPVERIPEWVGDPLFTTSLLATAAWWFGYYRHRFAPMIHVGSASMALAVYRAVGIFYSGSVDVEPVADAAMAVRDVMTVICFAAAGYLLISSLLRRSRVEALAALCFNVVAAVLLVWERVPADTFVICLTVGWSLVVATRVVTLRPRILLQVAPVAVLLAVSCVYDFDLTLTWYARAHGLGLIGVLLIVGSVWPLTSHRSIGWVSAVAYAGFFLWRCASGQGNELAATVVLGGFCLLAFGGLISWYKGRLLEWMRGGDNGELGGDGAAETTAGEQGGVT